MFTAHKHVNLTMAKGYDMDEPERFLADLGFEDAIPQQASNNSIDFTDHLGAGFNVAYKTSDLGRGIVQVSDVIVTRAAEFDQPPVNQHDLLGFLLELDKDPNVTSKRETIYKVIGWMNSYK